jgi:Outer membrane protein and related peptidoglycan-associated (lipo)proteins
MISYSIQAARRHARARTALSLTSVLLLAACPSAPTRPAIAAQGTIAVDGRTLAQVEADEQRRELEEMRNVNADARRNAHRLQGQIDALQADVVDRGLLLTLDDVSFAGNAARLNSAGSERLDKLVGFLKDYPHRNAQIESSVACQASAGYDATLSQRRAQAVASYLIRRGIAAVRLSARSNEESSSLAADCDAHSLHQNRQVIVIIEDGLTSARQP